VEAVVAGMWRYPVKSMQGEPIGSAELGESGLSGDRRWGVVDAETGKVLSAKREARLLYASACADGDGIVVRAPDAPEIRAPGPEADAILSRWLGRPVRLERASGDRPAGYEMNVDAEDDGSPVVDIPCPPGTFFDAAPVHLLTTATLRAAAARNPSSDWATARVRPTLLVDVEGDEFAEDAWIGETVRVGGAEIAVFAPTVRCVMPSRAQPGLPKDPSVSRTITRDHESNLGVYAVVRAPGLVAVGDPVAV
jgi:uncharacterized protein YcbX